MILNDFTHASCILEKGRTKKRPGFGQLFKDGFLLRISSRPVSYLATLTARKNEAMDMRYIGIGVFHCVLFHFPPNLVLTRSIYGSMDLRGSI